MVPSSNRWQHGFVLRKSPANVFHVIRVSSDGLWEHAYRLGTGQPSATASQRLSTAIDITPGGRNRLRLMIVGAEGWLFINDEPQGRLDLSAVGFDRVRLHVSDETEGAVTRFENFTVRELPSAVDGRSASGAPPTTMGWTTYLHRDVCPDAPNYEIAIPPDWVQVSADCQWVEYTHRDEFAFLLVGSGGETLLQPAP